MTSKRELYDPSIGEELAKRQRELTRNDFLWLSNKVQRGKPIEIKDVQTFHKIMQALEKSLMNLANKKMPMFNRPSGDALEELQKNSINKLAEDGDRNCQLLVLTLSSIYDKIGWDHSKACVRVLSQVDKKKIKTLYEQHGKFEDIPKNPITYSQVAQELKSPRSFRK